ncbi:MAG: hypothetical protein B6I31_03205 [Desulfobacteraceae bacterium 4572_19]|nr:MAG: hypothetical protein B6I31_03205 [Desulfobacteraceae bacterium 4572_19]
MSEEYKDLGLSEEELAELEEEEQADVEPDTEPETEVEEEPEPEKEPEPEEDNAQFDEGEVDFQTHLDNRLALEKKYAKPDKPREMTAEERKALVKEIRAEMEADKAQDTWRADQQTYLAKNVRLKDEVLYGAFVQQVNKLVDTKEGQKLSNKDLLAKAGSVVLKAFGQTETPTKGKTALANAKKKAGDKSKIPQTLNGVPNADTNMGDSKYGYLEGLSNEKLEEALGKLSAEDMDEYLSQ